MGINNLEELNMTFGLKYQISQISSFGLSGETRSGLVLEGKEIPRRVRFKSETKGIVLADKT